jgi:hypothetical protein
MYEALTGWMVTRSTMSSTTVDRITAGLAIAVRTEKPDVDYASLKAALDSTVTTTLTTTDRPHFRVIGVSFWDPVRD